MLSSAHFACISAFFIVPFGVPSGRRLWYLTLSSTIIAAVQGCIDKTNSILLKIHAQVGEGEDGEDTEEEEDGEHNETQSNCGSSSEVSD